MSFLPGPYSNGKWEVSVDGWRFYHDPVSLSKTSGHELRKYLCGYPGGPDWSFCLPEPFVTVFENRLHDEILWYKARRALDTEGWSAVRRLLEPTHGWPVRNAASLMWEDHRRMHGKESRAQDCLWCQRELDWESKHG